MKTNTYTNDPFTTMLRTNDPNELYAALEQHFAARAERRDVRRSRIEALARRTRTLRKRSGSAPTRRPAVAPC